MIKCKYKKLARFTVPGSYEPAPMTQEQKDLIAKMCLRRLKENDKASRAVPKKPAGCWVLHGGEVKYYVPSKPSWLRRFMTHFLLGWKWEDNND